MANTMFDRAIAEAKQAEAAEAARRRDADNQRLVLANLERSMEDDKKRTEQLRRDITSFVEGFMLSVSKHAMQRKWKSGAIEAARDYCELLVCHEDKVLPKLDEGLAKVIHDKFVYGIILSKGRVPEDYFVGTRQDWFAPLLALKTEQIAQQSNRPRPNAPRPAAPLKMA